MTNVRSARLRIRGKIPHVETVQRSYAMLIRDAALARLQTYRFFQGFTFRNSHAFKLITAQMPYCCVYFLGELLSPDGNANTGEIRFSSEARLGFSVYLLNNDPEEMEDRLDDAYQVIFNGLLRDPTFRKNDRYEIESFNRGNRSHYYGQVGVQNNETPYAEMRADLVCDLGAIEYEPRVEDMLEIIHVETVHPPGDTSNQHIISIYDVDQGE